MRPTGVLIHRCCGDVPVFNTNFDNLKDLLSRFDLFLDQVINIEPSLFVLPNSQVFSRWVKQVLNFLIIDFVIGTEKLEGKERVLPSHLLQLVDQMLKSSWHQTSLCLPIRIMVLRVIVVYSVWP